MITAQAVGSEAVTQEGYDRLQRELAMLTTIGTPEGGTSIVTRPRTAPRVSGTSSACARAPAGSSRTSSRARAKRSGRRAAKRTCDKPPEDGGGERPTLPPPRSPVSRPGTW
jgi:hypothetical protein